MKVTADHQEATVTAYPAWTPASRPGIVPLHPYGFGTILGRSFTALRYNPKVLLGFALVVQAAAYIVLTLAIAGVAFASFSRLDTLPTGSDEYDAVMAGSLLLTGGVTLVLGLAAGVLSVVVQGVVVSQVAHAVVAEKLALRQIWARVKPAFWRLIGYSALIVGAVGAAVAILILVVALLGVVAPPVSIAIGLLLILGAVPLYLWLSTKLLLVPAALILEGAGVGAAIARSWRLTRGRFWSTLGVIVVISLAFGVISQVISFPVSLIGSGIISTINPTGDDLVTSFVTIMVVSVIGQGGVLLVQSIALVVQATAAVLVYVDARMRVEGLDHDLLGYVDARDAGAVDLPDPYTVGVGRAAPVPAAAGAVPAWGSSAPSWKAPAPAWGAPAATWGTSAAVPGAPYGSAPAYTSAPAYASAPAYTSAPPPSYGAAVRPDVSAPPPAAASPAPPPAASTPVPGSAPAPAGPPSAAATPPPSAPTHAATASGSDAPDSGAAPAPWGPPAAPPAWAPPPIPPPPAADPARRDRERP